MDEAIILFFITAMIVTPSIGWYRSIRERKRLERKLWRIASEHGHPTALAYFEDNESLPVPLVTPNGTRVAQLEAQVDQLAQQLERVAESQDFLSRVLTDRMEQLPDPRMRTPH
ncbi:MAG: hypothetical protein SFU84_13880 [Gemmatimonadales bacterium]|nr:hypothetical protein [Gemmatimonadales bacterium]